MDNELTIFRELQPGTILSNGKYVIEKVLGIGGFGITYYAKHTLLNKYCAIKEFFIDGRCMRDIQSHAVQVQSEKDKEAFEKYRQKFIEEARILEKLDHPNIVKILDVFEENNTSYIAMSFIKGLTLQSMIELFGKLDYRTAVNYIAQIAEAVDYIHQHDILHRDIKPDNIIITIEDKAILIDFGSAREFVHDKKQSHTSIITQGYSPLEQYSKNSRIGAYTDIYAIGGVLYFALTGQKPVDASSRTIDRMPEPKELLPGIPEEVNRTTLKAMQLKSENRHQTVKEFMDDLLNIKPSVLVNETLGDISEASNLEKIRKKHTKMIRAIIIFFVCLTGIGGFVYQKRIEQVKQEQAEIKQQQEKELNERRMREFNEVSTKAKSLFEFAQTTDAGYYSDALELCNDALAIYPDNEEMKSLKQQIEEIINK